MSSPADLVLANPYLCEAIVVDWDTYWLMCTLSRAFKRASFRLHRSIWERLPYRPTIARYEQRASYLSWQKVYELRRGGVGGIWGGITMAEFHCPDRVTEEGALARLWCLYLQRLDPTNRFPHLHFYDLAPEKVEDLATGKNNDKLVLKGIFE